MPKPITPRTYIAPPGDPADVGYLAQSVTPPRGDTVSPAMRARQRALSADPGPVTFGPGPTPETLATRARAAANRAALRLAAETGISPREAGYQPVVHEPAISPWEAARRARESAPEWQPDPGDGNDDLDSNLGDDPS